MNFSSTKPRELLPGFLRGGLSWGAVGFLWNRRAKWACIKRAYIKWAGNTFLSGKKSLPQIKKGEKPINYCNKNQQVAPLSG